MNSSWIKVYCTHPHIINVSVMDVHGGKEIRLDLSPTMVDTINWMQQYRSQLEREQQLRAQDPAARELYAQYETYVNLTYSK
jgi:hypothetical protein